MSTKDTNKKSDKLKTEQKPKLEPKNINRTINGIFELNKKNTNP